MGEQEDPAGVKMGRRIPFLRDKLQRLGDRCHPGQKPGRQNIVGTEERKCRERQME